MVSDLGLWGPRIGDPCEFCGEPTRDHTDGEARSCWADIPPEEQCNPIRSPQCWKVTGMSRNGSPILTLVDGGGESTTTEGDGK